MYKSWLSVALGVGLFACGSPSAQSAAPKPPEAEPPDEDDSDQDEDTRGARSLDAGRIKDSGAADASRPRDAGMIPVTRDGAVAPASAPSPLNGDPDSGRGAQPGGGSQPGGGTPAAGPSAMPNASGTPSSGNTPSGDGMPSRGGVPSGGDAAGDVSGDRGSAGNDSMPVAPPTTGGQGEIGGGCGSDADCGAGLTCFTTFRADELMTTFTFPGGYCTKPCTADQQCGENGACPLAAYVEQVGEKYSQCARNCSSDADCRSGYTCGMLSFAGITLPGSPKTCRTP